MSCKSNEAQMINVFTSCSHSLAFQGSVFFYGFTIFRRNNLWRSKLLNLTILCAAIMQMIELSRVAFMVFSTKFKNPAIFQNTPGPMLQLWYYLNDILSKGPASKGTLESSQFFLVIYISTCRLAKLVCAVKSMYRKPDNNPIFREVDYLKKMIIVLSK